MKFCPTCQTRYDEEILRFCTKDGTPLVDEQQPNFIQMPSESLENEEIDDEATVIRRNSPQNVPPVPSTGASAERIVIPTSEPVRPKEVQHQNVPARKSNTAAVVLFTMLGTLAVLGIGLGGWYFLSQRGTGGDGNINANANTNSANQNTNNNSDISPSNFDFNLNANSNVNTNTNTNANANLKSPTPTKSPTPSPTKSPTPTPNTNANVNANSDNSSLPATPTPTPTPRLTPTPTVPSNVNVGVLNSRAVSLPKPAYPPAARQMNASGQVTVQVTLDEDGNVTSARAVNGHPLLRNPAETAARQSKFNPVRVNGQPVRATGVILYNFINQ